MSADTSIIYGFGFNVNGNDPNMSSILVFLRHHSESLATMYNIDIDTLSENDIGRIFSNIQCRITGHESVYSLVANIMSEETHINFQYEFGDSDTGSEPAILFAEGMPWVYNDTESALTKESLSEIIIPYMRHLGMIDEYPRELKIEYYG